MNAFQAFILGLVQGATEFLPISSSAHLVLVPWLLGWPEPGLAFDAMVHWGTLAAVVVFFWRDLLALARGWGRSLATRCLSDPEARLAWLILVGTIPGVVAGLLWEDFFEGLFGSPAKVAGLLLVTGGILAASERLGRRRRRMVDLNFLDSLLIGVAQACAIAPGISRSGATIAMGLWQGLQREAAARYSFLLATPLILGAGLFQLKALFQAGSAAAQLGPLFFGFLAAALSGYFCIKSLLAYLQGGKLYAFAIYCWAAGVACLLLTLLRGR
ncbi:MAG TPA: undecaprenyl-diphosphatase UppP [Anaerolineae bacterium]|nr:undecaprenyl-diphosphatase UppP [Anaerolineae bacterium]